MRRILSPVSQSFFFIAVVLGIQPGIAQTAASQTQAWADRRASVGGGPASPSRAGSAAVPSPAMQSIPGVPGSITDAGFAARLGNTVGTQAGTMPPGVGNINHPGVQPMPAIQPLIPGPPGHPNINFPGGTPAMNRPSPYPPGDVHRGDGRSHAPDHFGRGNPVVIYYGVPYYVPYAVYPQEPAAAPPTTTPSASQPAAKPLTLLAFKDGSVVVAREYWLEGDWLYYELTSGQRLSGPLDRLDIALTQQLNRERNVRFALESRP